MPAKEREAQGGAAVEALADDQLIAAVSAERDRAGSAHVVLALHEVDIVLVAPQQGEEGRREVVRGLTDPIVVDRQRGVPARAVRHDLEVARATAPRLAQVPVPVVRIVAVKCLRDAARCFGRSGVDPVLQHLLLEDRVDAVGDLLDQRRDRVGLLVLDDTVEGFVVAIGGPDACRLGKTRPVDHFVHLVLRRGGE